MNLIEQLRNFTTAEISDAMDACGVEGALFGIKPILPGKKLIGPAFTVKYLLYETKPDEFKGAADYIDDVPSHAVIVADNQGRSDCTTWGDILTQVALMKNIAGTVVNGAVRDVEFIRANQYPLFSSAITMRSGKNRVYKSEQQCTVRINNVSISPGDIIFGDDNGVMVIPQNLLPNILEKIKNIQATEDAIIRSVKSGCSLKEARLRHRYDKPWLSEKDK